MPGEPAAVEIPASVWRDAADHARSVFPAECCGWFVGDVDKSRAVSVRRCQNAQTSGDHPTAAGRGAETAYVIAGEDLLELNRELDGGAPPIVIYHSHPNGRAYFSDTDKQVATSPWGDGPTYPVQQLVIGIDDTRVVESALFAWSGDDGEFVEIARWGGLPED